MSTERFARRLAAVEAKATPKNDDRYEVLFQPRGLESADIATWEAENVAPLVAAGVKPLVVRFVAPGEA